MHAPLPHTDSNTLRQRAEARVSGAQAAKPQSQHDLLRLLHELQVHQIELEIQNEELRHTNARLQTMFLEKHGLYQAVLHKLTQPVQAMGLFVNALTRTALSDEQAHLLSRLSLGIGELTALSREISDLSKIRPVERDKSEEVALGPFLQLIADDYLMTSSMLGVRLRVLRSRLSVVTAPALLRRIIENVIADVLRKNASRSLLIGVRRLGRSAVRIEVWNCDAAERTRGLPHPRNTVACPRLPERSPVADEGLELVLADQLAKALDLKVKVSTVDCADGRPGSLYTITLPRRLTPPPV